MILLFVTFFSQQP